MAIVAAGADPVDRSLPPPKLGLVARLLQLYLQSGMRGRTRCTFALAHRLKSLQTVPVAVRGEYVFVNLEDGPSHRLLAGSPWPQSPWESGEQELMCRLVRRGNVAFDIGAHIGMHTVLLAELVGPSGSVHAFEPNPGKLPALAATVQRLPRATLHPVALGDRVGTARFYVPQDQSMASLANWTHGRAGAVDICSCDVRPLDDLMTADHLPQPDFVKCDVEGAELSVFRGARGMLDRADGPLILYEAHRQTASAFGVSAEAATDFLRGLRGPQYTIFHVLGPDLLPVGAALDSSRDHFNLLAVPQSRVERLQ